MTNRKSTGDDASGRFAYEGLERVFHEKARLGIMTSLVTHPKGLVFADLKELCALTDGNLSRHLQVLHEAGLIEVWKGFHRNRPQTVCRITDEGQAAVPRLHQRPRKRRRRRPPGRQAVARLRHLVLRRLVARLTDPDANGIRVLLFSWAQTLSYKVHAILKEIP